MIQAWRPPLADRPASRYSGVVTTEPVEVDWNRVAVGVANTAREHLGEEPIGVYQPVDDLKLAVLFGNGDTRYDEDPTAQSAVEWLRQRFARLGVMEIGFGFDSEASSTWAIIVQPPDRVIDEQLPEGLKQALNEAYRIAGELE